MLRLVSLGSVYKAERGGEYGRTRDSYAHWASAQWCRGPGSAGLGSAGQCGAGERLPLGPVRTAPDVLDSSETARVG